MSVRCVSKAIPESGCQDSREGGQHEDIAQLRCVSLDCPAKSSDERDDTGVEQKVQCQEKGAGLVAGYAGQQDVLFRRYFALLRPTIQLAQQCHKSSASHKATPSADIR